MSNLTLTDLLVILVYLSGITLLGIYFGLKKEDSKAFMIARGNLPGWVIGFSIFGTYLSSNTFLGIPGKAFSENWNSFIFSLSIPLAGWLASRYFIPFYREQGEISAYHQFEKRFGRWAKIYAVLCFVLTQVARVGSILFGVGLVLSAVLNIPLWQIIVITGIVVMIYTTIGGMEAVIWTDVVQSVLLSLGALVVLFLLILKTPGGLHNILASGIHLKKFSLGSWKLEFTSSTVWVVFLYGLFINLTNFGIDQNYVQRYHAARNIREASGSVWLLAKLYIPVSLIFFFIGTSLFIYSTNDAGFFSVLRDHIPGIDPSRIINDAGSRAALLNSSAIGDKVLPLFVATKVPSGLAGLIIAALLAAAMSTVSSSMNSTATIYLKDIHPGDEGKERNDRKDLMILRVATVIFGMISILVALAMIGVKSVLDAWWVLSGIFSGGLLGLFLLGWIKRVENVHSFISVTLGIMVIIWMTVPHLIPEKLYWLRSPFNANMIIVIGTLSIFISGILLSGIFRNGRKKR